MHTLLSRNHERRLLYAGALYRKGRLRVLWFNGVFCFGGALFVLFNVVDYLLDNGAPFRPSDLLHVFGYLALSAMAGYLYGRIIWRNLDRAFGNQ